MSKKSFISLIIIILALGLLIWRISFWQEGGVSIVTDKTEYLSKGILKVNIKNNLKKDICFSSCYPYKLEYKNKEWQSYEYGECPEANLAEKCIKPNELKGFELSLFEGRAGLNRLAVLCCVACLPGEEFKETERFYSNEFLIK